MLLLRSLYITKLPCCGFAMLFVTAEPARGRTEEKERDTCATSPPLLAPWVWASIQEACKETKLEVGVSDWCAVEEEVLLLAGLLAELLPRGRLLGFGLRARVGTAIEG